MRRLISTVFVSSIFFISACSDSSSEATYGSVEDLRVEVEDAGVTCSEWNSTPVLDDQAEVLVCTEGMSLATWDPAVTDEIDPENGSIGSTYHLRGDTWNIAADNAEVLDELAEHIGGEQTMRSLEVLQLEDTE